MEPLLKIGDAVKFTRMGPTVYDADGTPGALAKTLSRWTVTGFVIRDGKPRLRLESGRRHTFACLDDVRKIENGVAESGDGEDN